MHTHLLSEDYHALPLESPGRGLPSSHEESLGGMRRRTGSDQLRDLQQLGVNFGSGSSAPEHEEWSAVANLDLYFVNMYNFFHKRGLAAVLVAGVSDVVTLGFTVFFSTFLFSWVDWSLLLKCRDEDTCYRFSHYVRNPLRSPSFMDVMVIFWFLLFLAYWLWTVANFLTQAREAMEMHEIFKNRLGIGDRELQTIDWHEVVSRLEAEQKSGRYRIAISNATSEAFTAKDIACRIMRKENYIIAMLNRGILPLQLPVPRIPPFIRCLLSDEDEDENGRSIGTSAQGPPVDDLIINAWWRRSRRSYLTKTLEWSIHFCVLDQMLNEKFTVRQAFIGDAEALKQRFFWMGCFYVLLMPFILVFMVIHFFLKHAQEWNHSKNYLGPRQWDHLALWHFREFNELPHIFEKRVARSYEHAGLYVRRQAFHNPVVSVLARCLAFIAGSFVGVLLVLTLLDDAYLFHITLHDKNLLWYLGVFSAIFAFSRALIYEAPVEERLRVDDADEAMARVAEHTHYFPEHWRGKCNSIEVRDEFLSIFKFKAQLFVEEVAVVLLAPFVLCSAMPEAAEVILDFIRNHTVDVEGIGSVCGYSLFSFDRYGDGRYAAPVDEAKGRLPDQTEQGKMEKSFLNFKINHPDWDCGEQGERFISRLCEFQEQQVAARQEEQQQALIEMQLQHHSSQVLARSTRGLGGATHAGGFAPIPEDVSTATSASPNSSADTNGGKAVSMREQLSPHGSGQNILGGSASGTSSGDGMLASGTMSGSLHLLSQTGVGGGAGASLALSLAMSNTMLGQSSVHPTRTVESILQSALRESAQGASLRDVISRRGTYRGLSSSSMLDNHVDASFYWLDRYREQAPSALHSFDRGGSGDLGQQKGASLQSPSYPPPPPPPPPLPLQQQQLLQLQLHEGMGAAAVLASSQPPPQLQSPPPPPQPPSSGGNEAFSGDVSV